MKRKNATRSALFMSIISMLLCVSMLVGTTFAWFTDEVQTGMNTIAAGNLDVELLADGVEVKPDTKLFNLVDAQGNDTWWEPGMVVFEKLQVANVGTLALEYQMTLNFGSENDLNGHKLSEVLKVGIIDASKVDMTDRAAVLAAAKAATVTEVGEGMLSNFCITGKLEPKTESAEQTVVIFWAPNDNAVDNLYNANNGQKTSDGEPLHIEFGINLQATQMMHENDSFGDDYDMGVDNTPFASIVPLGAKTISATAGIGGAVEQLTLDAAFQYEPTLTAEEGLASAYKYYKADFFVYADHDVPANTVALAGYYSAWCDLPAQGGNWVALTSPADIEAGAENGVRLIEAMGGGSIAVHYKDICQYGNDGIGFLCGLTNLDDVNAGTTITVELRLYETDADPAGSSASNTETGNYITVATAKYTFPAAEASDNQTLEAALNLGAKAVNVAAGTYTFPASKLNEGVTLYCEPGTVFDGKTGLNINGATVVGATFTNDNDFLVNSTTINGTFKDCVFTDCDGLRYCYAGETVVFENCVFDTDFYGVHFDGGANDVVFKNCTFTGFNTFGSAITKLTMENCTFKYNGKGGYNGINLWGNSELINCTFVFDGSASYGWVDMVGNNTTGTFTGCVVTDGITERALTAADIGDYGTGNTITVN